ncbi:unnamed protein product, partial [Staurois parvus]
MRTAFPKDSILEYAIHPECCATTRGRLTIWKLGHCPRARDAPGTFFIGFFEFGQEHRGPMIPYCPG